MLNKNNSYTTIGIYLRCLRKLYNDYLENNNLPNDKTYPFGKNKYQIPKGQNIKKALFKSDIIKIKDYEPETDAESFAKDMFLFSYLCNGINISDILRLKYKNIQNDKIYFIREKTKNTTKNNQRYIEILTTEIVNDIIEKWKNKDDKPENFIFRELNNNMTEIEKRKRTQQVTKNINKYLKRIAKKLELNINLTTYVARHSFATILKREGASTEFIGESFGHSSILTTQSYLDSFGDDFKIEIMKKLL
jgi:site-specific recombinase XerD